MLPIKKYYSTLYNDLSLPTINRIHYSHANPQTTIQPLPQTTKTTSTTIQTFIHYTPPYFFPESSLTLSPDSPLSFSSFPSSSSLLPYYYFPHPSYTNTITTILTSIYLFLPNPQLNQPHYPTIYTPLLG